MRIALVSEHASPLAVVGSVDAGGQNVHVAALAAELARLGHRVVVYTRRDAPDQAGRVETEAGYAVVALNAGPLVALAKDEFWPHMPEFADALAEQLRAEPADLVHAHFWMSAWAAQRAGRRLGLPVVVTFHALGSVKRRCQGSADTSPPERSEIETKVAGSAARVLASCSDEVAELTRLGIPATRIDVVPCGVDVHAFEPGRPHAGGPSTGGPSTGGPSTGGPSTGVAPGEERDEVPERRQRFRLVTAGRLVPRKGVDLVIEALALLPDTELLIAGGQSLSEPDPERDRLLAVATKVGVTGRVRLLGPVSRPAMPALFRSADAVVCMPWYEPFGLVPLEAMACGVPVISAAVGGALDTVLDGLTGRLVPPRDPTALAEAARDLLSDPKAGERYGRAGAERARAHYSWCQVAEDTVAVYADVLAAASERVSGVSAMTSGGPGRSATLDRALVLGGAGFVGSHLCDALIAAGSSVVCLDNFSTGRIENVAHLTEHDRFSLVEHDVTTALPDVGPVDVVFHLASAASPIDYARLPIETLRAGSHGTEHALELATRHGARFVLASTSEVYGDPEVHPQVESYVGHVNPVGPRSVYDEAKRYAEALSAAYRRSRGTNVAIARIFNTYGPRMRIDDGRMVPAFIDRALDRRPCPVTGTGRQTRSLCYVEDTVAGLISLARSSEPGPVNLGNPNERTVAEIAELINELAGSEAGLVARPAVVDDPRRRCPDIGRAIATLDWRPWIELEQGLKQTIGWYAERRGEDDADVTRAAVSAEPHHL